MTGRTSEILPDDLEEDGADPLRVALALGNAHVLSRDHSGLSLKCPAPGDVRGDRFTFRDQEIDRHRSVGERCSLAPEKPLGIALPLAFAGRVILDTFHCQIRSGRIVTRMYGFEELVHASLFSSAVVARHSAAAGVASCAAERGWTGKRE